MQRLSVVVPALVATFALVGPAGCQIERLFADKVGVGVARLTVRNAALLLSVVTDDARCGFASQAAQESSVVEGELGGPGRITQTVVDCELDLGELHQVKTDCTGAGTLIGGRAVVSAVRTIEGTLTGNPANPIIPSHSDAVTIEVDAVLDEWNVRMTNRKEHLTNHEGRLSFRAQPHLAVSAENGVNAVPLPNLTLEEISYEDAVVTADDGERAVKAEVPTSRFRAQIGVWQDDENEFEGSITAWDKEVALPHEGDATLDTYYVAEEFAASYACTPDLTDPIVYEPVSLRPKLAQGAARLSVSLAGNLVSALTDDARCGFESPAVKASPIIQGDVGEDGGSVTYTVEGCALHFPEKQQVARDCLGETTYLHGGATVSATMTIYGILTGDPLQPVVPTSRDPAEIRFEAAFDGLKLSDDRSDAALQALSGTLSGALRPRMAKDAISGACAVSTPVVQFVGLSWQDARLLLFSGGNAFRLTVDDSDLSAQNGNKDGVENALTGTITIDGDALSIPVEGEPATLDPEYDPATFASTYACTPQMVAVDSDEDCSFTDVLAGGAARLLIQTAGTIASLVNKNSDCGFEDMFGVLVSPTDVQGEPGEMGSMSWAVEGCSVGSPSLAAASEDCTGGITYVQGGAVVDASRTVTGEREKKFFLVDSIIPRSRDAVTIELTNVALTDFVAYADPAGPAEPLGKLTIHTGTLSATVKPATGERADEPGVFDVPTPVAKLESVRLTNATATLVSAGKVFSLQIADAELFAVNGPYKQQSNVVQGSITVNGDVVELATQPLNPAYSQQGFDESYVCTENLAAPVPVGW